MNDRRQNSLPRRGAPTDRAAAGGFTIVEIMVVLLIVGLITAMVVPNLGAFVPKAKLDAAAKLVVVNIDNMRSEARIQGKRCKLEFDLDHATWRRVFPPEERLTTDADVRDQEPQYEDWSPIEKDDGIRILSAGNAVEGKAHSGVFALVFDHNGFTGDQTIVLQLIADPTMVWTINVHGLTGQCDVETDFEGHEHEPDEVAEGSF